MKINQILEDIGKLYGLGNIKGLEQMLVAYTTINNGIPKLDIFLYGEILDFEQADWFANHLFSISLKETFDITEIKSYIENDNIDVTNYINNLINVKLDDFNEYYKIHQVKNKKPNIQMEPDLIIEL